MATNKKNKLLSDPSEDSSKPRSTNGVKRGDGMPKRKKPSSSAAGGREKDDTTNKTIKRPGGTSKKQSRSKGDDDIVGGKRPRKPKPEESTTSRQHLGTDDGSSDEGDEVVQGMNTRMPEVGDEIAIRCPPDDQYPEGWYSCVVIDIVIHDENGYDVTNSKSGLQSSNDMSQNFTLYVEWDGGGEAELQNPEWRMKGDAPDKQGRVSHRDAKLRPYFKYWVNRLNSMAESEKKLSKMRAGKNTRVDPGQKVEWICCSSPSCGKWRPIPTYLKSSAILESCGNQWFCVLNSWDEAVASCGAPQETGYMPR